MCASGALSPSTLSLPVQCSRSPRDTQGQGISGCLIEERWGDMAIKAESSHGRGVRKRKKTGTRLRSLIVGLS